MSVEPSVVVLSPVIKAVRPLPQTSVVQSAVLSPLMRALCPRRV